MSDLENSNPYLVVQEPYRPPEIYVYQPPSLPRPKYWLHLLLFLGTIASTLFVGGMDDHAFQLFQGWHILEGMGVIASNGWLYSAALLAILTAHEFGHYFTAKYYHVPASPPYFIPFPFSLFGTLGAVIRMSPRIPNRRALFDIAAAGPLAGLIPAIPITFLGLTLSRAVDKANIPEGAIHFADPLLFKALSWAALGQLSPDVEIMIHPLAYAGWVGMFVTALNLLPIGQLDGGHITHALFGGRSRLVAFGMFGGLLAFSLWENTFTWVPLLVLLFFFGIQHPRIQDDGLPLGAARQAVGLLLGIVFVTCFSLVPVWM
ncbi:MAG: site-2 protease family protein [Acidobacteria bacterium]|nr:site-2 protease family protein [Acidobacteriota bacterium]